MCQDRESKKSSQVNQSAPAGSPWPAFFFPCAASAGTHAEKQSMKIVAKVFQLAAVVGLFGLACWIFYGKFGGAALDTPSESPAHKMTRWRAAAQSDMLTRATNDLVGFTRLIESHVSTGDDNLRQWSGSVTAEFVNHVGGVERTNMSYGFTSSGEKLLVYPD